MSAPAIGPATSDVYLAPRGGGDAVRLTGAAIRASWAVDAVGAFSCLVPDVDALAAGARRGSYDFLGAWLRWEHPTAGPWGGRVFAERWQDGTVELAAEGWLSLLRGRRTARTQRVQTAPAGALWLRAVRDAANDSPLLVRSYAADEHGPPVQVQWRGDDLWDLTQRLVGLSGFRVHADHDRNLRFRERAGEDKRGRVLLAHGHGGAVARYRWERDAWTVENDLLGVAGDADYDQAFGVVREDGASIERYGRVQGVRVYPGLVSRDAIAPRLDADLALVGRPRSTLELEVADMGGIWALFREGDTVRVELGRASALLDAEIEARSLDLDRGTMRVAAVATEATRGL